MTDEQVKCLNLPSATTLFALALKEAIMDTEKMINFVLNFITLPKIKIKIK